MPGLFDNAGPFLSGFGGVLGGLGRGITNAQNTNTIQQSLGPSADPGMGQLMISNPPAAQEMWQRKIFYDTFNSVKQKFPNMSDAEVLTRMTSPGGMEGLFVPKPFGEYRGPGGMSGPGVSLGSNVTPPFPGFSVPGGGAPSSPQQSQPSSQPNSGLDNLAAQDARYAAQKAAAVKAAEQTATAQPDLPIIQTRAQEVIARLQKIRDNPELPNIIGGPLGIKGRAGPLGQGQSDLLSDIQDANNALQGDLFTSMRTISSGGKAPSVGAMKEMRITDLNARTGTVQAYKDNIDRTIKQVQNEYESAWKARNSPDAYKPNWTPAASQAFPTPTAAHIQALKSQPQRAAEFDGKFGRGAAMRVLGQ